MDDIQELCTEEKTEPFSQSEYEKRIQCSFGHDMHALEAALNDTVPLDYLVVDDHHRQQGVRLLMRPLIRNRSVSPGSQNCRILALRAEIESGSEHKVLAVTHTHKDILFSVCIPEDVGKSTTPPCPAVWCELYFDPLSDNQVLINRGDVPITLRRETNGASSPSSEITTVPDASRTLAPGTWHLRAEDVPVLDFRILAKRPRSLSQTTSESEISRSTGSLSRVNGKRSFSESQLGPESPGKRQKHGDNGAIVFMTAQPLVVPLPGTSAVTTTSSETHAMLNLKRGEALNVTGGCELDTYTLTKKKHLHSTRLSNVFSAEADHPALPNGVSSIVVKVLNTAVPADASPRESERNVMRQADMWLREFQRQQRLEHRSIVRLYAGDARFLSLYMEHVDAPDLSGKEVWRNPETDMFVGSRDDAERILRDISGGLGYLHQEMMVHNDIKPANILYSRDRGAVLCDFGLATPFNDPSTNGGTPYYIPPEYIGGKERGPPSDVWALGVVMLYVLHKIAFPESRGKRSHQKHLYWHISEVNKTPISKLGRRGAVASGGGPPSAMEQMRMWLLEVNSVAGKLNRYDKLESLVANMLRPARRERIRMKDILKILQDGGGSQASTSR